MADKKQEVAYGKAGGESNQGQGLTRFEVGGDPSEYFPVWAAGSMAVQTPAFLMDAVGAAYRYGTLKVNGLTNLVPCGEICYPIIDDVSGNLAWTLSLILGQNGGNGSGTGGNDLDAIQNAIYARAFSLRDTPVAAMFVNGEVAITDTNGGTPRYGACVEQLTLNVAGTVTCAAASTTVTGAGTTFTTAAFDLAVPPYNAYVPCANIFRIGDIIEMITGGVSYYYRVLTITDNTHVEIHPPCTVNIPAASAYKLWRTGFMSSSRMTTINDGSGHIWGYYAGMGQIDSTGANKLPTLMCATISGAGRQHQMAPQTSAAADIRAVDCIYFKGFLLYGFRGAIGWSAGPFPSAFPFGTADFPAGNISAFNLQGDFCHFEQIGEQVFALFDDSVWIVQATGGIPEFQFYRVQNIAGVAPSQLLDVQSFNMGYGQARGSCSGRDAIYYLSAEGIMKLSGLNSVPISAPVDSYDIPGPGVPFSPYTSKTLSYDPATESVVTTDSSGQYALCYRESDERWYRVDFSGHTFGVRGITGGFAFRPLPLARRNLYHLPGFSFYSRGESGAGIYWPLAQNNPAGGNKGGLEIETTSVSATPWVWATPIISLGDIYDNYQFGGFKVWARAASTATPPVNLTWTVYGGSTPYGMVIRDTGVLDYSVGTPTSRQILSKKLDDNYLGFVLTGSAWIELAGIGIYNASTKGRR